MITEESEKRQGKNCKAKHRNCKISDCASKREKVNTSDTPAIIRSAKRKNVMKKTGSTLCSKTNVRKVKMCDTKTGNCRTTHYRNARKQTKVTLRRLPLKRQGKTCQTITGDDCINDCVPRNKGKYTRVNITAIILVLLVCEA